MIDLQKNTIRFIIYTLVIGGSFYLGTLLYSFSDNPSIKNASAKPAREFRPQLEKSVQKDFYIQAEKEEIVIKSSELKKWIEPFIRSYSGKEDLRIIFSSLNDYLLSLAPRFNIEPVNAKFSFQDNRADTFIPSSDGKKL